MVERSFRGSGNRRGELNPPKTTSFPAHNPVEVPSIQNSSVTKLRKFVPSGLPIGQSGLQEVRSHTNNVGCPPTPGHIVIPIVKEPVKKQQRKRNAGEIFGGTSEKSLSRAKKKNRTKKQPPLQG